MVFFQTGAGFASMTMHHIQTMYFMLLNTWRVLLLLPTLSARENSVSRFVQVALAVALLT